MLVFTRGTFTCLDLYETGEEVVAFSECLLEILVFFIFSLAATEDGTLWVIGTSLESSSPELMISGIGFLGGASSCMGSSETVLSELTTVSSPSLESTSSPS